MATSFARDQGAIAVVFTHPKSPPIFEENGYAHNVHESRDRIDLYLPDVRRIQLHQAVPINFHRPHAYQNWAALAPRGPLIRLGRVQI